jgi:hypothetical protein
VSTFHLAPSFNISCPVAPPSLSSSDSMGLAAFLFSVGLWLLHANSVHVNSIEVKHFFISGIFQFSGIVLINILDEKLVILRYTYSFLAISRQL